MPHRMEFHAPSAPRGLLATRGLALKAQLPPVSVHLQSLQKTTLPAAIEEPVNQDTLAQQDVGFWLERAHGVTHAATRT